MSARFFISKSGFRDGTAYIVLSEGEFSAVAVDGAITELHHYKKDKVLKWVADLTWKEITCDQATSMLKDDDGKPSPPLAKRRG
ncbi:hypothetical protein LP414_27650 [Polaromonas sp. P1(28)-13]|nr:hypothetical protein LP414_27650 [Polaromonas sp. P1(28)-13]